MTWIKYPLRIIDAILVDREAYEKGEFDPRKSIRWKKSLGFNAEHFSLPIKGPVEEAEKRLKEFLKLLPEYLAVAREENFRVFVYINVHWHDVSALSKHPDWYQVDYEGKIIDDVYGRGLMPCINTPWRQESIKLIKKIAEYKPDGIFLDGPVFHRRGCYCKYCRKLFEEKYGPPMPRKGDLDDPRHLLLIEFQQDSMASYMRDAYNAVKEVDENIAIYLNGETLRPNWATGRENRKLAKYQDLVGAEGGFEYFELIQTPIFKPGMTAKLLEAQAPDKPRVIFNAAKHSPWNREPITPEEIMIRCLETIANGAFYWVGITYRDPEMEEALKEVNKWVEENEDAFFGTRDASKVGLYWSQFTANLYGGTVPVSDFTGHTIKFVRDYMKSFVGAYEVLLRSHVPFKVVCDYNQLADLDLVVLPNVAHLTEEEAEALREFVEKGGLLIASFETSLYEVGRKLENFRIADLLGVKYLGLEEYGRYENYFTYRGEWYPCYTYVIKTTLTTARALGVVSENTQGYYQPIKLTEYPSITLNDYGKGRALYFCGNFFQTYSDFKFAKYLKLFNSLLDELGFRRQVLVENAPSSLEITLRKKDNKLYIHLVNFTSDLKRPIEYIALLKNIKVVLSQLKAKHVRRLLGKDMHVEVNKHTSITLDEIHVYEVLEVELS